MITMGSHIATSVTKLTVTPPSGQSGGPCVWFVYEKGDGASKEDVLTPGFKHGKSSYFANLLIARNNIHF